MRLKDREKLELLQKKAELGKLSRTEAAKFKTLKIMTELAKARENEEQAFQRELRAFWNKKIKSKFANDQLLLCLKDEENFKIIEKALDNAIVLVKEANNLIILDNLVEKDEHIEHTD